MTVVRHIVPDFRSTLSVAEDYLWKKLRVSDAGREDGLRNHPAADATEMSKTQVDIISHIRGEIEKIVQWQTARHAETAEALLAHRPTEEEQDYAGLIGKASYELARHSRQESDEVVLARTRMRASARHLRAFRHENRLHRDARSSDWRKVLALVLAVLFVETVINSQLFASASPTAWVGGASLALMFAFVNLLIGFVVIGAFGLRHTTHVKFSKRILGWTVVVAGTGIGFAYNAWVAVYREAIRLNPLGNSFEETLRLISEDPVQSMLSDQGPVLFLLGCASLILFSIEGYILYKDQYLGHHDVTKAAAEAEEEYELSKQQFRAGSSVISAQALAEVDQRINSVVAKLDQAIVLVGKAVVDNQQAEQAVAELVNVMDRGLTDYREANGAVRDEPAPASFFISPRPGDGLPALLVFDFETRMDALRLEAERLKGAAEHARQAIRSAALEQLEIVEQGIVRAREEGDRLALELEAPVSVEG
ncbi:hypothetical protein [Hyphomonas sp.]|uniref:hypothetical protein n=1 Tax=Hyphomonas sp. TaxID=87 RepID=UPI0025BB12BC|nr:hypothetical protein [Hyphomonas sp.]